MRKIIHVDMDCFYAAVEERDNPQLRGKPLAVGGSAAQRGVLCTCNYPARRFGLHAAMPTAQAFKLCPELVLLPVRMDYYAQISREIRMIFHEYTPFVEPLSLDEAYLDVTRCLQYKGSATLIAKAVREKIYRVHNLVASAGVAPNKLLAKIASDWKKPNGLFVITPEQVADFVVKLPVSKLFGVGKVTAGKLQAMSIATCGDLQQLSLLELAQNFGIMGSRLYEMARGIDKRAVEALRIRKSVSVERTFASDIAENKGATKIVELFAELEERLQNHSKRTINKQFVKIKFADFTVKTMERRSATNNLQTYQELFRELSNRIPLSIRLLGIGVGFTDPQQTRQQELNL